MSFSRRPLWQYPLFQIPLLFLGGFLVLAALFWLFGLGRPQVNVAIALDLSYSTYSSEFNEPGSIMNQEVQAVEAYLEQNASGILRRPNQVQVFGFGGLLKPLTGSFNGNSQQVKQELNQALKTPGIDQQILPNSTNLSLAIQGTTERLAQIEQGCRELLLVTDGQGEVSPSAVGEALRHNVRINAVVVGAEAPALQAASLVTRGIYLGQGEASQLDLLFRDRLFAHINTNLKWILLWLACAWVALMWLLVMPLDRWIFQDLFKFKMNTSGQLALGNAFFWTAATPGILWKISNLLDLALPFFSGC
ncbi:VWA domain-containing protein [Spirulina subsalsa FACHB-351]|uniref:VWA domain-containing protein n=1 Tax=Spirulina subsalsa FACHB-351 TaxID=234711 RepID=A0ABT3L3V5_9CYAN|nr:vWA domain-containing protein [Spirulina subsalsa]MCW6036187.1 VWA domain-containing protein [Spirulina subsalsa FACHB-351]